MATSMSTPQPVSTPQSASTPQPTSTPQRHPIYYLEDASDVIRVDDTLFKVYRGMLARHSEVLRAMFSLPRDKKNLTEGATDENPIYFEPGSITASQFAHILFFVLDTHDWQPNATYSEELLVDVLTVASRWMMPAARKWAIHHLELLSLPPGSQIKLALEYGVSRWIPLAFSDFVHTPWERLTGQEIDGLAGTVIRLIGCVKDALLRERIVLALNIPQVSPLGSIGCENHAKCNGVWHDVWLRRVLPAILHPDEQLPFDKIEDFIRGLSFLGMNPNCLRDQLSSITGLNAFNVGERLVLEGGTVLQLFCRSESKHFHLDTSPLETPVITQISDMTAVE